MSAATSLERTLAEYGPGLYPDIPEALYHARIPGLVSKSVLDKVDRSPAHYEAWLRGAADETSPALEMGKAVHCRILEPELYSRIYVVAPSFGDLRFKENKAKRDAWKAEHGTKTVLDPDDAAAIEGMAASVMAHRIVGRLLREGRPEVTARWKDRETGLECKLRGDWHVEKLATAVDLKTSEDARPGPFAASVARYRYHVQQAHYTDGFAEVGATLRHFVFAVVEKKPPYAVAVYSLDDDAVDRGREATRRNMATLADCIERGEFPGYSTSIETLSLPRWA